MLKKVKEKSKISADVVWSSPVISVRNGKQASQMRVVKWIIDGEEKDPQFEKRQFFVAADGSKKIGKVLGLKKNDMEFIIENWDQIGLYF